MIRTRRGVWPIRAVRRRRTRGAARRPASVRAGPVDGPVPGAGARSAPRRSRAGTVARAGCRARADVPALAGREARGRVAGRALRPRSSRLAVRAPAPARAGRRRSRLPEARRLGGTPSHAGRCGVTGRGHTLTSSWSSSGRSGVRRLRGGRRLTAVGAGRRPGPGPAPSRSRRCGPPGSRVPGPARSGPAAPRAASATGPVVPVVRLVPVITVGGLTRAAGSATPKTWPEGSRTKPTPGAGPARAPWPVRTSWAGAAARSLLWTSACSWSASCLRAGLQSLQAERVLGHAPC